MRKALLGVAAVLLLAAVATPVAARWGMPEPLTERGQTVEAIYAKIAIVGIVVFLLVFVLLVIILLRFRESTGKGRATHERHRGSLAAEMVWTVIPLFIMLWIGYIAYVGLVKLDLGEADTEPEMSVTVIGSQWSWAMDYGNVSVIVNPSVDPETGVVTYSRTFHLPADVPIQLNVTGTDVIHAFNIMDANRAYFSMDDANPLGPHKYHSQILTLPEGTYSIQCKEMCLNPGHAYMRAELVVEPQADFDRWLELEEACVGADLCQTYQVALDDDAMTVDGANMTTIVAGTRVVMVLANTGSSQAVVELPASSGMVTVPAGQSVLAKFDTAVAGDFTVQSQGRNNLVFRAVEAKVVEVELGAFELEPDHLELEAGTTYLVQVRNTHGTAHNLYIGHHGADHIAASATIAGGASTSFIIPADQLAAGDYDMWCDVPGHYDLGMHGTVSAA